MTRTTRFVLTASLVVAPVLIAAQGQAPTGAGAPGQPPSEVRAPAPTGVAQGGLDPASLLKPLGESWPTNSGDNT